MLVLISADKNRWNSVTTVCDYVLMTAMVFSFSFSAIRIVRLNRFLSISEKSLFKKIIFGSWYRTYCFAPVKILDNKTPTTMKLDTPEFKSVFTPELQVLGDLFAKHGYELRIAGGAVRDLLLNETPHDLDFATTATPEQMKKMFTEENIRMINMQGEKHGTITPRINDKENFEVTTLRIDVLTDGRHAKVEFTTDWELDANRRDLTINSMFLGLDGTVYDYFSGYKDLLDRHIAFVGDPNTRIQEDYLRILRYFRFFGRIAKDLDSHDANTLQAIKNNAEGLRKISGERIWSELHKILEGNFAESLMKTMLQLGLGIYIGLPDDTDVEELSKVCSRMQERLRAISIIATLLKSQEDVINFHARCKLSGFERDLALFLVEHRGDKISEVPIRPYQRLVLCSKQKMSDVQEFICEVLKYRGDFNLLKEFRDWQVPRFPITGNLLKEKGVPSGKVLGIVLQQLKDYWIQNDFTPEVEELLQHLPEVLSNLQKDQHKK